MDWTLIIRIVLLILAVVAGISILRKKCESNAEQEGEPK